MPNKRHTKLASTVHCPQCHTPTMWEVLNNHREIRYKCSSCGIETVVFKVASIQCPPPNNAA